MKKKKKLPIPRREWKINPTTRVKKSDKLYSRARVRRKEPILNDDR